MKFTWNWLKDHLDTTATLDEILDILPMIGLEVEEFDDPKSRLADFTVAEIVSAERHPNADKLQVCSVNTGTDTIQIVCGAPNARAGLKTVLARPGTYIPGLDITIKKGDIRGEESHGMLCSASELGISDDHDGIMELSSQAEAGSAAAVAAGLDDPVIEIAITPNRGDCLGVRGIARDLAAAGYGTLKPLDFSEEEGSFDSPVTWSIETKDPNAVPIVSGRYFRSVTNQPSPAWMQQRLTAIGQRPIDVLVDITNYIMFDIGRPLHAYDADKIVGDKLIIRNGRAGETLTALNEKTYELDDEMIIIGDQNGPDDIAGVMGGERTGVSETTTNMFLEIAIFDPVSVAITGRKLNLNSDARYRFERGLDADGPTAFAGYITRFIKQLTGAQASHLVLAGKGVAPVQPISFSPDNVTALTGVDVSASRQQEILEVLGFDIQAQGDTS
ncbi:MAG: phenylalanine--tRNA ligase subunit beta [Candidatus Puniceispirillaceae bacterium]